MRRKRRMCVRRLRFEWLENRLLLAVTFRDAYGSSRIGAESRDPSIRFNDAELITTNEVVSFSSDLLQPPMFSSSREITTTSVDERVNVTTSEAVSVTASSADGVVDSASLTVSARYETTIDLSESSPEEIQAGWERLGRASASHRFIHRFDASGIIRYTSTETKTASYQLRPGADHPDDYNFLTFNFRGVDPETGERTTNTSGTRFPSQPPGTIAAFAHDDIYSSAGVRIFGDDDVVHFEFATNLQYTATIQEDTQIEYTIQSAKWVSLEDGGGVELEVAVSNPQGRSVETEIELHWSTEEERQDEYTALAAKVKVRPDEGVQKIFIPHSDFEKDKRSPEFIYDVNAPQFLHVVIDPDDDIFERNEENNFKALQVVPLVVNIVTHGWNPTFSRPPVNSVEFLGSFLGIAERLNTLPVPDSILHNRVASHVPNWDSTTGFTDAVSLLVLAKIADGVVVAAENSGDLVRKVRFESYSRFLKERVLEYAELSRNLAYRAASQVSREVKSTLLLFPGENQGLQKIQLIGHSRGAAVNAIVSNGLAAWNPYYFAALDGFAPDWPDDGGLVGDAGIHRLATAQRRVNYRVGTALGGILLDTIDGFIDSSGASILFKENLKAIIAGFLRDSDVLDYLLNLELRAPPRFTENLFLKTTGNGNTNHVTITPEYLASGASKDCGDSGSELYFFANYIGEHCSNGVGGGFNSGEGEALGVSEGKASATEELQVYFRQFNDGNFEELGTRYDEMLAISSEPDDEPFSVIYQLVTDPKFLLQSKWLTTGDAQLGISDGNSFARLTQTYDTSLGQVLVADRRFRMLQWDMTIEHAGIDDSLQVLADGKVLTTIALAEVESFSQSEILLPAVPYKDAQFQFRMAGPTDDPAIIQLDNIQVVLFPTWQNESDVNDVNDDGSVSPLDVLLVINELNAFGSRMLPDASFSLAPAPFLDVNGDGFVAPLDALLVINELNAPNAAAEGDTSSTGGSNARDGVTRYVSYSPFVSSSPNSRISRTLREEQPRTFQAASKTPMDPWVAEQTDTNLGRAQRPRTVPNVKSCDLEVTLDMIAEDVAFATALGMQILTTPPEFVPV